MKIYWLQPILSFMGIGWIVGGTIINEFYSPYLVAFGVASIVIGIVVVPYVYGSSDREEVSKN